LVYVWKNVFASFFECPETNLPPNIFRPPPRSPTFLGEIEAKKIFLLQGIIDFRRAILADTPPRAIPFNVHTPLWMRSIKFEPLRKKYQSADTNTPPPEIKKFLPYPSEKMQRSKDADAHNPSETAFSNPIRNSRP
jgi:hypothetical protein